MSYKHFILFLFLLINSSFIFAQQHKTDSLLRVLKAEKDDTSKVKTLNILAFDYYAINPDTTILLAQQAGVLAERLSWKRGIATSELNTGVGLWAKSDYSKAMEYDLKALDLDKQVGTKQELARDLVNIGNVCYEQGDFPKALDNYLQALKLNEETGYKEGEERNLGNIANTYHVEGDYSKALDYGLKALKLSRETGNKGLQANFLGTIGNVYFDQGEHDKALGYFREALVIYNEIGDKRGQEGELGNIGAIYENPNGNAISLFYHFRALKIADEIGDKFGQALNLGDIGSLYTDQGDSAYAKGNTKLALTDKYPKALDYDMKALKINMDIGAKEGVAANICSIGNIYIKTGKLKEAGDSIKKAISIDSSIGELSELGKCEESLSNLYAVTHRYDLSLYWYKKAMVLKDTLFNLDKNKALTRKELTFKFTQQQDSVKSEQARKDAITSSEQKRQNAITASVSIGLGLVLLFSILLFNRFRLTQKQKRVIEEQKTIVEEKNKDILDSITYAKRLQDAILPPMSHIKQYFPESFVLYKPKDIVAGDFYWLSPLPPLGGQGALIAACDCTGHGVPGAMVSVVCSNALNRAVKEFHLTEPGKILDKTRELVLETFQKSEGNIQDGMDISLCSISQRPTSHNSPAETTISWSGAYNPLWYIQIGALKELAPDKQPIGITDNPKPFRTQSLALTANNGACLYLFTDGFADQFGGPKGKKFKYKRLQELLLANATKPMEEQKAILENEINKWQGRLEQTDDICVIGIRI